MGKDKKQDRREAEFTAVLVFSLDEIFMIIRAVTSGWHSVISLILLASLIGIIGVCFVNYKNKYIRSIIYSTILSMSMLIYSTQMDSVISIIMPTAIFIIVIGMIGEVIALIPALIGFLLTILYHAVGINTIVITSITDAYTYIVPIGNVLLGFILIYTWSIHRSENEEKIKAIIKNLKTTERIKDDFLANISHEIRTPINTISGMSEILAREELKEETKEKVNDLQIASRNLVSLVSDILDFSEIQSDKLEILEEKYCLTSTINDIVNTVNNQKKNKNIEFIIDIDTGIPASMIGDVQKIKRALLNILSNAVKFTEDGCVVLEITYRKEEYGVNLSMVVKDSGIGIDRGQLQHVFNSFSMVDTKRNRQEGGVGLGLAISQAIIEKMGGFISAQSELGEGSEFKIVVPQKVDQYAPMISVENPSRFNVLVFIDMSQFEVIKVRNEYEKNIRNIADNLNINIHMCQNLNELKRRVEKNYITHIFITLNEYTMDELYFNELAKKTSVIIALEEAEESSIKSYDIVRLFKPFYALPVSNILKGEKLSNRIKNEHAHKDTFVAPSAKILIVDDNAINLKVASGLMKNYGFKIDTALSGKAALEMLDSKDYDLVFLDHMMPEMDGVDTLHRIRDKAGIYFANLPIVALTANAVAGAREMLLNEGFQDFLAKPIELAAMHRVLEKYIPDTKKERTTVAPVGDTNNVASVKEENLKESDAIVTKTIESDDIDEKQGITYCGSLEDFEDILRIHYDDYTENRNKIIDFYSANDWNNYVILVHGLKSSMKSVGIMNLSNMCLELEMAGKEGRYDFILENHEDMIKEYDRIRIVIGERIGIQEKEEIDLTNIPNIDDVICEQYIDEFENAVYSFDEDEMHNILNRMMEYKYHEVALSEALSQLPKKVDNSDYMSALDNLKKIILKIQEKGE